MGVYTHVMGERVKITDEMRQELRHHKARTVIGPYQLLEKNGGLKGITVQGLSRVLNGHTKTILRELYHAIILMWKNEPDYKISRVSFKRDAKLVKVSKAMLTEILKHIERSGLGAYAITKGRKEAKPIGLTGKILSDVLSGASAYIRDDHLYFILERYRDAPDKTFDTTLRARNVPRAKAGYHVLTSQEITRLHRYRELGFIPSKFLKTAPTPPKGFSVSVVSGWLNGSSKTAKWAYLCFVMDECEKLRANPKRPIIIDDNLRAEIQTYIKITGHGGGALLKNRKDVPEGLTKEMINTWTYGACKTARTDHINYALERWQDEPENVSGTKFYPEIQRTDLTKIRKYIRAGLTASVVFRLSKNVPYGLTPNLVRSWIDGRFKKANPEYVDFYLKACAAAAKHPQRPIVIAGDSYAQLILNRDRTGVGAFVLLNFAKKEPPRGLSSKLINAWLSKDTTIARKDYLKFVLALWKSLPDKEVSVDVTNEHGNTLHPRLEKKRVTYKKSFAEKYPVEEKIRTVEKRTPAPKALIVITYDMHQQLMVYNQQAHISGAQLLKNAKNAPQGLRPEMIDNWIIERFKTARKDHWDYVMALYEVRMQK